MDVRRVEMTPKGAMQALAVARERWHAEEAAEGELARGNTAIIDLAIQMLVPWQWHLPLAEPYIRGTLGVLRPFRWYGRNKYHDQSHLVLEFYTEPPPRIVDRVANDIPEQVRANLSSIPARIREAREAGFVQQAERALRFDAFDPEQVSKAILLIHDENFWSFEGLVSQGAVQEAVRVLADAHCCLEPDVPPAGAIAVAPLYDGGPSEHLSCWCCGKPFYVGFLQEYDGKQYAWLRPSCLCRLAPVLTQDCCSCGRTNMYIWS